MAAIWLVECPAYTAGPFAAEVFAQRNLEHIEALGACMFDHHVRRPDAQPAED